MNEPSTKKCYECNKIQQRLGDELTWRIKTLVRCYDGENDKLYAR